jgi:hypothetical protein
MGAGGIVIIRNKLREVAELDQVKNCQTPGAKQRLEAIVSKDTHDWTDEDYQFVLRALSRVHDDC